jgi:DtxR family Mn-dependent transcriptional regulator
VSESGEEYLEALYTLEEKGDNLCRIKDIAGFLGVQPPSVVEMLRKLEKNGLVDYKRQKGVLLTDCGKEKAQKIVRAHRLVEVLLSEILHIDTEDMEEIACSCEHAISGETADKLCTFLGHPTVCPHGNPIPKGQCCE